jgi:hypothetical protein
MHQLTFLQV